jgi:hypothetical protein
MLYKSNNISTQYNAFLGRSYDLSQVTTMGRAPFGGCPARFGRDRFIFLRPQSDGFKGGVLQKHEGGSRARIGQLRAEAPPMMRGRPPDPPPPIMRGPWKGQPGPLIMGVWVPSVTPRLMRRCEAHLFWELGWNLPEEEGCLVSGGRLRFTACVGYEGWSLPKQIPSSKGSGDGSPKQRLEMGLLTAARWTMGRAASLLGCFATKPSFGAYSK